MPADEVPAILCVHNVPSGSDKAGYLLSGRLIEYRQNLTDPLIGQERGPRSILFISSSSLRSRIEYEPLLNHIF
jgi:hypothetical protein